MHFWFIFLLFGCLLKIVISRPQRADYNNDSDVEETEEEDSDTGADIYSADDDGTRLNDQEPTAHNNEMSGNHHVIELSENRYVQRSIPEDNTARVKADTLLEPRVSRNREITHENLQSINSNEPFRSYPKRRQSNKYIDSLVDQRELPHLLNHDIYKGNHIQEDNQVNKRTVNFDVPDNEEGDMIFEKNRDQVSHINKNEYSSNDASDSEQQRYFKQYYNTMQAGNRDMINGKSHDGARYNLRDRREVNLESQHEIASQDSKETNDRENEESAIKRHIKKLSSDELDRLLNSLSEEKRDMLKKIIDEINSNANGYFNKREITKKAEAVEEINYIENSQSDVSKVHSGSSSLDMSPNSAASQSTEVTEGTGSKQEQDSQTDNPVISPKGSESNLVSVTSLELINQNDETIQKISDDNLNISLTIDPKNQADLVANIDVTSKTENKRAVDSNDLREISDELVANKLPVQDYSIDQDYSNSENENVASLANEENQHLENKAHKREVFYDSPSELSDSFKSLQESFPNSNTYDDRAPYTGPLVRVKRKNCDQVVKKRSPELLPNNKVGYFPYEAEIEAEDNDEGNEFNDVGFYDHTSNFIKDNQRVDDSSHETENSLQAKSLNADNTKLTNDNVDSDMVSIGSDTDSVLSGVEGVDNNLMYSCGTRNKRTPTDGDKSSVVTESKIDSITSQRKEDMISGSENYAAPNYQENDAFGPLPRNYDGDLARYKRIRRVKQLENSE